MTMTDPTYASRCRRKRALIDELKTLPPGDGDPVLDQDTAPTPAQVGDRRAWLQAELDKLADVPILSAAELRRLG